MSKKLAIIHTSPSLTPLFTSLCSRWLPEVSIFHMVDESLIKNTIEAGHLEKVTTRRVIAQIESARLAGADAVLVTCSSIGAAVTQAASLFDFPIVRIDDAMAERAVHIGHRLGVLATLQTTLAPTSALVRSKSNGHEVTIIDRLIEGAFDAVMAGDGATHDQLVRKALTELIPQVDCIVLAQASMARVLDTMEPASITIPVLSSPELAVQRVAEVMSTH